MFEDYFSYLVKKDKSLILKLEQARIKDKPEDFLKKVYISSFFAAFTVALLTFVFVKMFVLPFYYILIVFFITFFMFIPFFKSQPDIIIKKKSREIEKELLFATRFLMIEIQSGVSLFDAMINISKNYEYIGKEFSEIVNNVNLGTSLEDAIENATEKTPSNGFRKVLWQILNSLKTGANIADSLNAVIEQITREQMIEVKEYGRKLNPLAMFYMIMAVILPSIGITMAVLLSSFLSLPLDLNVLLIIAGFLFFMQFMFYNMIRSMRPAVDL